jgi:molybdate-binding protein
VQNIPARDEFDDHEHRHNVTGSHAYLSSHLSLLNRKTVSGTMSRCCVDKSLRSWFMSFVQRSRLRALRRRADSYALGGKSRNGPC